MNPTPDPDSASEETPLIVHGRDDAAQLSPNQRHRTRVLVIVILILLIMDWASFLGSAPQLDIFEAIICDRIYREDNTTTLSNAEHAAGRDCTINSVQSELALVTQILSAVSAVPSIFLAIPYGALADRIGRRPVLFVCIIGLLLQDVLIRCITWWPSIFPLWLVWFTPLTTLVGGGSTVASAMLYLAVADVVEERERATWFSQMGVAILAGEIVAAPAASALMQSHGPWLPYLLGTAVIALASPLALFLPETNQVVTAQEGYPARYHAPPKSVGHQFKLAIRRTSQSLGSILNNRNAVLVLLSYFVVAIARNPTLDIQFMRQRFKWKFSSAILLVSLSGFVKVALLLVILPLATMALNKRNWAPIVRDIFISKSSAIFAVLGSFLMAVSFHPAMAGVGVGIMSLAAGFSPVVRSVASSLVSPEHIGTLYTSMGLMVTFGIILSGPLIAVSFNIGLRLGGLWSGLPYLIISVLFLFSLAAISHIRPGIAPELLVEEDGDCDFEPNEP